MFRIVALIVVQLLVPCLIVVSGVSIPYAYADSEPDDADDADDHYKLDKPGTRTNKPNSSSHNDGSGRSHQRHIRKAVQQKKILPLGKIKQHIEELTDSEIIRIELEREHGQWVYEFKVIDSRGHLREIYVDATSGKILKSEPTGKRDE